VDLGEGAPPGEVGEWRALGVGPLPPLVFLLLAIEVVASAARRAGQARSRSISCAGSQRSEGGRSALGRIRSGLHQRRLEGK
jgi:hypothetical protein